MDKEGTGIFLNNSSFLGAGVNLPHTHTRIHSQRLQQQPPRVAVLSLTKPLVSGVTALLLLLGFQKPIERFLNNNFVTMFHFSHAFVCKETPRRTTEILAIMERG